MLRDVFRLITALREGDVNQMGIFKADSSNFDDWINLSLLLFPEHTRDEMVEFYSEILTSEKEVGFLYKENDKFVGYMNLSIRSDYVNGTDESPVAFVEAIFVLPEYRKQNIARKLIEHAEDFARQKDLKQLASDCLLENEASARFHESCGFTETERVIYFVKNV